MNILTKIWWAQARLRRNLGNKITDAFDKIDISPKDWPKFNRTDKEEYFRFVRNVCLSERPSESMMQYGCHYNFSFQFREITIEIDYDYVRDKWGIKTLAGYQTIFYYWPIHEKPYKAIKYVVNRFKIEERIAKLRAEAEVEKKKKLEMENELKNKYSQGRFYK